MRWLRQWIHAVCQKIRSQEFPGSLTRHKRVKAIDLESDNKYTSHLIELKVEVSRINGTILGLSEVPREDEDTMVLDSGHLFYFCEGVMFFQGGVDFLFHKTLASNVGKVSSISTRVAYLVLKLTER
ncbi:unnamed protein product [Euphydryas editha]|uniref:Uncharacterized protein n=1 Tax=Euphydryas editha TaxID=104508 RepID=A0AAU9UK43_EUPED|nr:unnamed protein product [Euphydryas editha]